MSAHVLLNLLNKLGKSDKMRGLRSILSLFCNKFNKFNSTRARMLDSVYHLTLRLLWNLISAVKMLQFCHYVNNVVMDVKTSLKICKPLLVYRFYYMALFHSQTQRHMIKLAMLDLIKKSFCYNWLPIKNKTNALYKGIHEVMPFSSTINVLILIKSNPWGINLSWSHTLWKHLTHFLRLQPPLVLL